MFLKSAMKFPSRVETNSGAGSSLYKAAGQHCGLGPGAWSELRRYCHDKMAEWWQWYQPYYTFPLQVTFTSLHTLDLFLVPRISRPWSLSQSHLSASAMIS